MRRTRSRRWCSRPFAAQSTPGRSAVQRASLGVDRRSRIHQNRRRTVAILPRGRRRVGSRVASARWIAGPVSRRVRIPERSVLAVHGVQMTRVGSRASRRSRRDARHLSAQQRPHRRRRAADRRVLRVRRSRRHRHRQPGEHARSECLRGAGDDARAGAGRAGVGAARQRDATGRARAGIRRRLRHD